MKCEDLSKHLEYVIEDYTEASGASDFKIKKGDAVDSYSFQSGKIRLEFVYSKKARENYPVSTLYCRVFLDGGDFFFEIPEIISFIDILDYHCYYYPYIESRTRIDECFNYIMDFIEYRREEIESLCPRADELKSLKLEEIKRVYKTDDSSVPEDAQSKEKHYAALDEYVSSYAVSRFTTGEAYGAYLRGDFEKALSEYGKLGELTEYEKKIVNFIDGKQEPYQAMPLECSSLLEADNYKRKSLKLFLVSLAFSVLLFWFIFFCVQAVINAVYTHSSIMCDGANPFKTALFGIVPGVLLAVTFRNRIEPLFYKDRKKAFEFYDMLYPKSKFGALQLICIAVCIFCVCLFADFSRPTFTYYKDRIEYNTHAKLLNKKTVYPIEDFVDVVCVNGRYSQDLNEYIEEPFYVLEFSNDQYIDLGRLKISKKEKAQLIEELRQNRESDIRHVLAIDDL